MCFLKLGDRQSRPEQGCTPREMCCRRQRLQPWGRLVATGLPRRCRRRRAPPPSSKSPSSPRRGSLPPPRCMGLCLGMPLAAARGGEGSLESLPASTLGAPVRPRRGCTGAEGGLRSDHTGWHRNIHFTMYLV